MLPDVPSTHDRQGRISGVKQIGGDGVALQYNLIVSCVLQIECALVGSMMVSQQSEGREKEESGRKVEGHAASTCLKPEGGH